MGRKRRLAFGVGVNDADYNVFRTENGKIVWRCPLHTVWYSMLSRCYSETRKKIQPTYRDVTVCKEWHSFTRFRAWMEAQDWEGKQLDKDILVLGNRVYSSTTCVFVDGAVNKFLTDCAAARGEWPIGVWWSEEKQKFQSYCNNPFTKKREYLGYFHCPNQAHDAWRKRKHQLACQLADLQTDQRVAEALRIRYK